jgi:hypothetical protein
MAKQISIESKLKANKISRHEWVAIIVFSVSILATMNVQLAFPITAVSLIISVLTDKYERKIFFNLR